MEAVIFFALGYFTAAALRSSKADLKNPDRILRWDPDTFGWRPIAEGTRVNKDETVLFAYEMTKSEGDV